MALEDWNMDGKNDLEDDLLEYHIYEECTKNTQNGSVSSGGIGDAIATIVGIIIALAIAAAVINACDRNVCDYPGCDDTVMKGSDYCWTHQPYNR